MEYKELTKKHFDYLEKEFGISKEDFERLIDENGDELEELFDTLAIYEVDDPEAEELINFIESLFE